MSYDPDLFKKAYSLFVKASSNLFSSLKKRPELEGKVTFPEGDRSNSACFRLQFVLPEGGSEHPIGGVSISIPPDANGNNPRDGCNPTTYELMLLKSVPSGTDFFSNASLMNVYDPFGYDQNGWMRFYDLDVDGLVEEILRLSNCLSLPLSAFPLPYDDEFNDESDGYCNDQPNDDSNDLSKDELKIELNDVLTSLEAN
jgi:hypothetical protein